MKKNLTLAFCLVQILLKAQTFQWGQTHGDILDDDGLYIVSDTNENSYSVISFKGSKTFGSDLVSTSTSRLILVKTDSLGNTIFGKLIDDNVIINDMKIDKSSGRIYLVGSIAGVWSSIYISIYNTSGVKLFTDIPGYGIARKVAPDGQGNYYIAGQIGTSTLSANIFLAKQNLANNLVWQYYWSSPDRLWLSGLSIDKNLNPLITGDYINNVTFTDSNSTTTDITLNATNGILDRDAFIVKYSNSGDLLKAQTYNFSNKGFSPENFQDELKNIYLFDYAPSYYNGTNMVYFDSLILIKLDSNYTLLKTKTYPMTSTLDNYTFTSNDSNIVIYRNDTYVDLSGGNLINIKILDKDLNELNSSIDNSTYTGTYFLCRNICIISNNQYYVTGQLLGEFSFPNSVVFTSNDNSKDAFIGKMKIQSVPNSVLLEKSETSVSIYPNPSTNIIYVKTNDINGIINIYSISGQKLISKNIDKTEIIGIDITDLEIGIYFIGIDRNNGKPLYRKIVKE